MSNIITMDSAHRIWSAHREIAVGDKLLKDIRTAAETGAEPTPLDPWNRRRPYTLGAPQGENGHRLLDVSPKLAAVIIEAHIAAKRAELAALCATVFAEAGA